MSTCDKYHLLFVEILRFRRTVSQVRQYRNIWKVSNVLHFHTNLREWQHASSRVQGCPAAPDKPHGWFLLDLTLKGPLLLVINSSPENDARTHLNTVKDTALFRVRELFFFLNLTEPNKKLLIRCWSVLQPCPPKSVPFLISLGPLVF